MAVPLNVQNLGGLSVGSSTGKMKFVDCPVVESTPALTVVL